MRRLVVVLMVTMVMAAAMMGGALSASAQVPGETAYCAPWQQAWYVSESEWWYYWWWRWCYKPSILGGWYVDWAGWEWDGYAGLPPGYYSGGPS